MTINYNQPAEQAQTAQTRSGSLVTAAKQNNKIGKEFKPPPPPMGLSGAPKMPAAMEQLKIYLQQHGLIEYLDKLVEDGIERKEDLAFVSAEDLMQMGLSKYKAKKVVASFSNIVN